MYHGRVGEALEEGVALLDAGEARVGVRGERGEALGREVEELVEAGEGVADDLPVAGGAGVADADFYAVGGAGEGAVFAEELRGELVAEEVVPALEADLLGAQGADAGGGIAELGAEVVEPRGGEALRRGEGHVDLEAEDFDGDDFHARIRCPCWRG